ncbi:IclR family transcriptional regulator [Trebonia kvetii]|uniref:IclR family transcriptional regulator n=1 Tax=Trebonia kvetii TaxID=2480626 RepID=A0A6P2BTA1_9ACTN|nr:IclR family transcriptional regulator [Trebonia kvetii]TVZ02200.1 IclR family transcriptional regulator [Trebonia kvetii]
MTSTDTSAPASMIDRVAQILDAFNGPASLTVAQVVVQTGVPRSSAHRILEHLVRIRWLYHDEDGSYRLGLGVLELGGLAAHQNQLRRVALPYLHELADMTGMVVHLAVLDGPEVVYLDKIGGSFGIRLPSRIGGRQPAHCTAVGKTLLAFAGEQARRDSLAIAPRGRTSRSITTDHRLRQELSWVKDRGIAFDREEALTGIGCVASPVGPPPNPAAAISICGPVTQVQFERLISPVRMAASQIWSSLASAGGGRPTSAREAYQAEAAR